MELGIEPVNYADLERRCLPAKRASNEQERLHPAVRDQGQHDYAQDDPVDRERPGRPSLEDSHKKPKAKESRY